MKILDSIQFIDPVDGRWQKFLGGIHNVNIFHNPSWSRLIADCYGYHPFVASIIDSEGNIRAGIPLMERRGFPGKLWISLPFTDHCAPLYDHPDSLKSLLNGLSVLTRDRSAPEIELRWNYPECQGYHLSAKYVLSRVRLDRNVETVKNRMKGKHRRIEQVAKERGVRVIRGSEPQYLDTFYRLHLHTRRRLGVPVQPKQFFTLMQKYILSQGLGFILLAYKGDQCLAADVFFYWRGTLTYKYSATSGLEKQDNPNDALLWEAIRFGCEQGYEWLDMGRSDIDNEGLRFFKKRWGAEETNLNYYSSKPSRKKPARMVMPIMNAVIQKSPLWVCKATGELFYKYFR